MMDGAGVARRMLLAADDGFATRSRVAARRRFFAPSGEGEGRGDSGRGAVRGAGPTSTCVSIKLDEASG